MLFATKKLLGGLLMPAPMVLALLLLCFFLLRRSETTSRPLLALLGLTIVVFWMFSCEFGASLILRPLENRHPPLLELERASNAVAVVVLGGGHTIDGRGLATSALHGSSQTRLLEALRMATLLPGTTLILAGGAEKEGVTEATLMQRIVLDLGFPQERIAIEESSRDTADQAQTVREMVGAGPVVLVTSAVHMPRSVAMFERQGIEVIPAPTDHQSGRGLGSLWPDGDLLGASRSAVHELIGLNWAKLRGLI